MGKPMIEIKGMSSLLSNIDKISGKALKRVDSAIEIGGLKIEADAKKLAPVDTGALRRMIVSQHKPFFSRVQSLAKYSQHVNFGTRFMVAQPYFTNAVKLNQKSLLRSIEKAVRAAL